MKSKDHERIKKIMKEIEGDKFTPPVPPQMPEADEDLEDELGESDEVQAGEALAGTEGHRLFGKPNGIHIHIALGKKR